MARRKDDKLLKEIRDRYRYACDAWSDIKREGQADMRYIAGDPWDDADKRERRQFGRPALVSDELSQYVNQAINNVRQNPRGIKVDAKKFGAKAKTAELHEDTIREIEYASKAWRSSYLPAYECALQRSYGFFRISREYDGKSFNQVIRIKGILNPDTVTYDPDCKEANWSDAEFVFITEPIRKEEFSRRFPKAQKRDFSEVDMQIAKDWIRSDHIVVAEYWKAIYQTRNLLALSDGRTVFEDELEGSSDRNLIVKEREYEDRSIVQYLTNGVEILSETEEPQGCKIIPIIPVIGKEIYVNRGSGPKRELLSLIRLARDPQMLLCYLVSQEAEEAKLTPKVPYLGYKGQFESDKEAWESITDQPRAYVQADPVVDASGAAVLPLPQRQQFVPNFQQYEIAKDGAKRAIQAAMGITPLPTAAQRRNEKSGVALDKIQEQESVGSFHFVDNLDRAMELGAAAIEERLGPTYDSEREHPLHKADNSRVVVMLNTKEPYVNPETQEEEHYVMSEGEHDITITTGPSYQSQRQAASEFLDTLISNIEQLPLDPGIKAKLLSLAIQMKQLGPLGDEMAEIISPDNQQLPPQAMAALQQGQQQVQALNAYAQQLEKEIQDYKLKEAGKVVDNQFREQMNHENNETKLAIAEVGTKFQSVDERLQMVIDLLQQWHSQAHELKMQAAEHAHQAGLADQQAANQSALQDQQAGNQAALQQQAAEQEPSD